MLGAELDGAVEFDQLRNRKCPYRECAFGSVETQLEIRIRAQ